MTDLQQYSQFFIGKTARTSDRFGIHILNDGSIHRTDKSLIQHIQLLGNGHDAGKTAPGTKTKLNAGLLAFLNDLEGTFGNCFFAGQ